jgi:integrase
MPTPKKPPRLYLRNERTKEGIVTRWIIRDGKRTVRTGCSGSEGERAAEKLQAYLASRYRPDTSARHAAQAKIADILTVYMEQRAQETARPKETVAMIVRLNRYWGDKTADQIRGDACRAYVKERGSQSAARRELELLRAAVNHYAREYGLDATPKFTLPEKSPARQRWLTRSEAARLLWAARQNRYHSHVARFILIGLYTGTRHRAICAMQWMPNTQGGWVDLERGVMFRKGEGERETNKRRTPVKLGRRLLAHMKRWKQMDRGLRHIIRYEGQGIDRLEKSFRVVRERAGLGPDVTPHVCRHTRATWLMQRGVPLNEAAQSLGMTIRQLEQTYFHHHPDWQRNASEAY